MKKIMPVIIALVFVAVSLSAQERGKDDRWERYRAEKVAFLTEKLDLTPAEAQKFWPVYNQLEEKRGEAQKARRDLEGQIHDAEEKNLSQKEIVQLTRDYSSNMGKEGGLYIKYNEEFLKILPPAKVLKLYRSEKDFKMYMIRKFRDRERNGDFKR